MLTIPIGVRRGSVVTEELTAFPHLIVAGETGSGKSNWLRSTLTWLAESVPPERLRFDLIDRKFVELVGFAGLPHVDRFAENMTDINKALSGALKDMENRARAFQAKHVVNIADFNRVSPKLMPYRVIVIDEYADICTNAAAQAKVLGLARKARYAGIHLILSTQRPSSKVVSGEVKVNIPARLCFSVFSKTDSRVILDSNGAEQLKHEGQALFRWKSRMEKVQALWLDPEEANIRLRRVKRAAKEMSVSTA